MSDMSEANRIASDVTASVDTLCEATPAVSTRSPIFGRGVETKTKEQSDRMHGRAYHLQ